MMSVAVSVWEPAVLRVTLTVRVPADSAPLAGSRALESLEVIPVVRDELTTFQFSSTALTVTLKALPAVRGVGEPVLPVAVAGAAVSPGTSSCSFTNAPGLTVMAELVLAVLLPLVRSLAVSVRVPAVLSVTLKVCVPEISALLAGRLALASEEVIPTVSVTVVTAFQLASTALTVTLNGVLAVCAVGAPVLPVALPGAAVSPGTRICSLVKAPALTVIDGLVLAVLVPSVISVDVIVQLPAHFGVTAKVALPAESAALAGWVSAGSVVVMPTVSVLLTGFQLASTALTVTLNDAPALCAVGVPDLPIALPGAAVSPGTSNCIFTKAPALTVMDGLVLAVLVPSIRSEAVKVCEPAVLSVTLRFCVPETRATFAGRSALASLDVMLTVWVTVLSTFQKTSTALTVTLNEAPAVRAVGAPVLPPALPGAAVSPGTSSWSLTKAAGLTTTLLEVAPVRREAVKLRLMVLATLWDRLAKVAMPLTVVAVSVPCSVPVPAPRATVMTRPLSVAIRLPTESSTR